MNRFIRNLFTILVSAGLVFSTASVLSNSELPEIGDTSRNVLTPAKEDQIGKNLIRYLKRKRKIFTDPLVAEYIQSLGNRLVANSDDRGQDYTFLVINDHTINAFAAPGKIIGVHTGLIDIARSESELAAVMAHEVAHITQKHLARLFESRRRTSLLSTAAVLAAMLVGNSEMRKAAIAGASAASIQAALNFTRANEKEADRIGIRILVNSNFDPQAIPRFFERMQNASSLYGTRLPEFLRTHPISSNRIAEARTRVANYARKKYRESINFLLMRARIRVANARVPEKAVRYYRLVSRKHRGSRRTAARYGLVLALIRSRRYAEAKKILAPLLRKDPARLAYIVTQADIAMHQRQTREVIEVYATALDFFPKSRAIIHYYADALLTLGQPARARKILLKYLSTDQDNSLDASMHNLYSIAAARTGKLAEAFQHKAEYYYLNGQTRSAIEQLELALRTKKLDEILASRLEARLRQMKNEIRTKKK